MRVSNYGVFLDYNYNSKYNASSDCNFHVGLIQLYCTVLFCIVLYCIILYYIV